MSKCFSRRGREVCNQAGVLPNRRCESCRLRAISHHPSLAHISRASRSEREPCMFWAAFDLAASVSLPRAGRRRSLTGRKAIRLSCVRRIALASARICVGCRIGNRQTTSLLQLMSNGSKVEIMPTRNGAERAVSYTSERRWAFCLCFDNSNNLCMTDEYAL